MHAGAIEKEFGLADVVIECTGVESSIATGLWVSNIARSLFAIAYPVWRHTVTHQNMHTQRRNLLTFEQQSDTNKISWYEQWTLNL